MKTVSNWQQILKHAWSIRLMAAAAVLSAAEVALPFIEQFAQIPTGLMAALSALSTAGAFVARIAAQKEFGDRT